MDFLISAVPAAEFQHYFVMDEAELANHFGRRLVADGPGFPCRVSLMDAAIGEDILLINYEHQPAPTPYRASHAIFIRRDAVQAQFSRNEIPQNFYSRTLSLRGFDHAHMLKAASVVPGADLDMTLRELFDDAAIAYIHIHNAKHGCYHARPDRA